MDTKNKLFDAANTAGWFVSTIRAAEVAGIGTLPCIKWGVEKKLIKSLVKRH